MKSDAAKEKLAKLALDIGRIAVGKAGHRGNSRQRCHQHGVVGKPEQVERVASDPRGIAGLYRAIKRSDEDRPDQVADLGIKQAREFAVVEMARGHQPQPLRFLFIRAIGDSEKVTDHAFDQFDQRRRRRFLAQEVRQIRIGLAFLGQDLGV